jgi:Reverse transcriptase (RNA-dependent DNA polymerase)
MDGLMLEEMDGVLKTRVEHATGTLPSYANNLRTWGEAGVVKLKTATTPKFLNKGTTCVFVGYPENHGSGTYLMYNPQTKGVHTTRDVVFLRRMYWSRNGPDYKEVCINEDTDDAVGAFEVGESQSANTTQGFPTNVSNTEEERPFQDIAADQEDEATGGAESGNTDNEQSDSEGFIAVTRSGRGVRAPTRLIQESEFGNTSVLSSIEKNYYSALLELGCGMVDMQYDMGYETGLIGAALGGGFGDTTELKPMKFDEAMRTENKDKWLQAVEEEFHRMMEHKVFKLVRRASVPKGSKVLTSTWAMKKKSNGTFRARVNGRGYEQEDGEHYDQDDVASPMVNIVTIRVMLVLMLLMGGCAHLVDVNGAFLLGGWEHDPITHEERKVYMEIPQGFHRFFPKGDWLILLLKTIYGTKQAAKRFWLFILGILKSFGY